MAEIGERLNIGSSKEFLGRNGIAGPFLFKALDVALSEQVVGLVFSSRPETVL
jgi:hypothetical protein